MDALMNTVEWLGILIGGIVLRFLVFVLIIAALSAVIVPILYGIEGVRLALVHRSGERVHGLEWRRRPRYTPAHLWLRERAGVLRVGIDDLAARLLRHAEAISLPARGARVAKGEPVATFRAGAQRVALGAPVDGVVIEVNDHLSADASDALNHPYGRGWLVDVAPDDRGVEVLPRAASRSWFDTEAARFTLAIERAVGVAAADGGEPVAPERLLLSDEQFASLAREFLQANVGNTQDRPGVETAAPV
jgi:glycine cleavage system H protein